MTKQTAKTYDLGNGWTATRSCTHASKWGVFRDGWFQFTAPTLTAARETVATYE